MPDNAKYLAVISHHSRDVVGVCLFEQIASAQATTPGACYVAITSTEFRSYAAGWAQEQRAGILHRPWYKARPVQSFELVPT